ncbi:MAG TPA: phosphate signaling complex protein PhoU [Gaiellaceae bacterium]|nr:phosphate signaling complex protein PhoU [Gaiellaceae bacterium]
MESREFRITFHEELQGLEDSLQQAGALVVRSVQAATRALAEQDLELADEVIAFDDEVDGRYSAIQAGIESLLARQTPVATDLRLVLALLHVNLHLERMADYCVTVAKLTKLAGGSETEPRIVGSLAEMGVRAEEMTRVALRSFQHRDLVRAEALPELDELIDRANRRTVEHVLELSGEQREWGLRMLMVSRCLERIGDHAVDIGEQTAYLVTGEFREFTDASHPDGALA